MLVVGSSSEITELERLRGARLGFAHRYCTTSYFAPALLLRERGYSIGDFFAELVVVPAYEGQIDSVIAGRVDATMVQEDVLLKTPDYARTTRVIVRKKRLPTPLVIVDVKAPQGLKHDLTALLLSCESASTQETLFSGFVPYQRQQVEEFIAASALALPATDDAAPSRV